MAQVDDERMMTRFLLGDAMAPADRTAIEERLIADPTYFEALCALEEELILKWHRGELSDAEVHLFTETYLSSPSRQGRVASVRELIEATERWKHNAATRSSFWSMRRWLGTPLHQPQYALRAAAALLLVAVLGVAVYQIARSRAPQRAEQEQTAPRTVVAFTLSPVTERGPEAAGGTNVVRIPRDADEVSLRFETIDPGSAVGFDTILQPLERVTAPTARPARVERTAAGALVTLTVAVSDLPDGDYLLRLRRITTGDTPEIVATRAFRVTRD